VWCIFPSVPHVFECAAFFRMCRIFKSVAHFSKCVAYFELCRIFSSLTHVFKWAAFLWPICPGVNLFSRCNPFFPVWAICPDVTQKLEPMSCWVFQSLMNLVMKIVQGQPRGKNRTSAFYYPARFIAHPKNHAQPKCEKRNFIPQKVAQPHPWKV